MTAFTFFGAGGPQIIQINLAYTIAGLLVIVLSAGIAWGSLRKSVEHLESDIGEIKADLKSLSRELTDIYKRATLKRQ